MSDRLTDYTEVPWFRKSEFNSFLLLAGLILPPFMLWLCINCLTGKIYYSRKDDKGFLKTWGSANKLVALVMLIVSGYASFALATCVGLIPPPPRETTEKTVQKVISWIVRIFENN